MTYLKMRHGVIALGITVAAGLLLSIPEAKAFFAHSFPCDWKAGFVPDPVKKERVGYVTDFNGVGLAAALAKDLTVHAPFAGLTPTYTPLTESGGTVHVVGVIESVSWGGGVGDPFIVSCYMSQENAHLLKTLKSATLKTTSVASFGFWIGDYDPESKKWFEAFHPLAPAKVVGQINTVGRNDVRLHVSDEAVKVSPSSEVGVYNVYFEVVPAANQTATFHVATSPTMKSVLPWGFAVGRGPGR
jgi:hypothetical protein